MAVKGLRRDLKVARLADERICRGRERLKVKVVVMNDAIYSVVNMCEIKCVSVCC